MLLSARRRCLNSSSNPIPSENEVFFSKQNGTAAGHISWGSCAGRDTCWDPAGIPTSFLRTDPLLAPDGNPAGSRMGSTSFPYGSRISLYHVWVPDATIHRVLYGIAAGYYHVGDSDIIPAGTLTGYVSWDRSNVSRWKAILDHG